MQPVRKLTRNLVLLAATVFVAGCLQSVHPLFTEDQAALDPELLGTWSDERGELIRFTEIREEKKSGKGLPSLKGLHRPSEKKAYLMTVTEKDGDTLAFVARLGQIGDQRLLDYTHRKSDEAGSDIDMYYLSLHQFLRMWIAGDTLRIAQISGDWLKSVNEQEKHPLEYSDVDGHSLTTASTKEMQDFLERNSTDSEGALEGTKVYYRKE